ncbi:MAG: hypothetical protein ACK49R_10335 [Planctomycetota bacterium]
MRQAVYMAGSDAEAGHHVQSLRSRLPLECLSPEALLGTCQPGDLVLFYSEHFDRFRAVVEALRARQVGTLYLIDGILEWRNAWENRLEEPACPWTMRPVLCDVAACIGTSQARILAGWGNFGRLEIVGVPRFDRLREPFLTRQFPRRDRDGQFRLLVMTAKCPGFTPDQIATTVRSLQDVRDQFPRRLADGREVVVTWRLTAGLADSLQVENQIMDLTGVELSKVLAEQDAVISTPSTAGLEAMLTGRPLAWLDYHRVPQWVPAAWTIGSAEDLPKVIEELARPAARRMLWQEQLLLDHLYLGEPATERLDRLLQRMLQRLAEAVNASAPVDFSGPLLEPPSSQALDFDHASLYPSFSEFEEREITVLQTEWAHARREIAQLQRELRQARSELAEAHAIFDEIHRHPIAGPVVRLRQRMIEQVRVWRGKDRGTLSTSQENASPNEGTP